MVLVSCVASCGVVTTDDDGIFAIIRDYSDHFLVNEDSVTGIDFFFRYHLLRNILDECPSEEKSKLSYRRGASD